MAYKSTIGLDFDGVVNPYMKGWQGIDVIPEPPLPGTKEAIAKLREQYRVVIFSTRCAEAAGRKAIADYCARHEIVVDDVTEHKPKAVLLVDDRAFRFEGDWGAVLDFAQGGPDALEPWNRQEKSPTP